MLQEEEQLFNEYVKAKELEKQPLTDKQKKCKHRWYKTWTWHSGGFQKCTLCGRVETFYERD